MITETQDQHHPAIYKSKIICQGAEAIIYLADLLGEEVICKERFHKTYRHPDLDKKLAKKRIVAEVKSLDKAR